MKRGLSIASDILLSLAVCAWVGGRAALGAFAARITFRTVPRELAAPTMNQIFREFGVVTSVAIGVLLVALLLRVMSTRFAERLLLLCGVCLIALGLFGVLYVEPQITQLYLAGRSLDPEFQTLHRLSERSAHLELLFSVGLFYAMAKQRVTS